MDKQNGPGTQLEGKLQRAKKLEREMVLCTYNLKSINGGMINRCRGLLAGVGPKISRGFNSLANCQNPNLGELTLQEVSVGLMVVFVIQFGIENLQGLGSDQKV